jgi:cell fate (sporulation/competence/biofilm development) regulator YlbF (YheA/YmcA/DUF963 family)
MTRQREATQEELEAKRHIEQVLRMRDNSDKEWAKLLMPDRVHQTYRALALILGGLEAQFSARNAKRLEFLASHSKVQERRQYELDFAEWRNRANAYRTHVVRYLQQASDLNKQVFHERSEQDLSQRMWDLVEALARAVDEHRRDIEEPNDADRLLWARLDVLRVPRTKGREEPTLAEWLDSTKAPM